MAAPSLSMSQRRDVLTGLTRSLRAGLPLSRALELAAGAAPAKARPALTGLAKACAGGVPLADQRADVAGLFGEVTASLAAAGETGGDLEGCLEAATRQVTAAIELRNTLVLALAYPLFLGACGLLFLPFPTLFNEGFGAAFLGYYLPALLVVGAVVGAVVGVRRGLAGPRGATWEARLSAVPLLGLYLRARGEAQFLSTLGALLAGGVAPAPAVDAAAAASGSKAAQRGVPGAVRRLDAGEPLSAALAEIPVVTPGALQSLAAGEETGTVPGVLAAEGTRARDDLAARGKVLAVAVGLLVAAVVVGAMIYQVIGFWAGYYGKIEALTR